MKIFDMNRYGFLELVQEMWEVLTQVVDIFLTGLLETPVTHILLSFTFLSYTYYSERGMTVSLKRL